MKHQFYLLVLLLLSFTTGYTQIYSYTSDSSGLYNNIATNATGVKLTRHNGATRPTTPCAIGFSSTSFGSTTTYATTLPAVEADVTANAGYSLNVTGFSVGLRRSGTGPANVRLAYSTNGGSTWTDKGADDAPNNAGCGTTTTATWATSFTVPASNSLKFRLYGSNASGITGTLQILNLSINGTVVTTDSIFTSAASFGPFCEGMPDTISIPFTQSGTFAGLFNVQLSDASGIFPTDATSNIISSGSATSPITAVIPSGTAWANGYRVRVVNTSPTFFASGDNGSNIIINQSVSPSFGITASTTTACTNQVVTFTTTAVINGGNAPVFHWFVNGSSVSISSSLSSSTLHNNDSVFCIMVSNASCAVPTTVNSNVIGMTVYPTASTDLYDTICPGTSISYGGQTVSTSGSYPATLSTVNGCDSTVTLHLTVKTIQTTNIPAAICQGDSFTWKGNTYSSAGTYSDTVRCDSIVTLTLAVNQLPVVTWNTVDTFVCNNVGLFNILSGGSPAGGFFSGQYVSNDTFYNHLITANLWIAYTFTDNNHCSNSDSLYIHSEVCEGITEVNIGNSISVYPNPTENIIHVGADNLVGTSTITVSDIVGKVLLTKHSTGSSIHEDMDLSAIEKGIYLLTIHDGANHIGTKQIVRD